MDRLFDHKVWGIPWSVVTLAALVVAVIYIVIDTSNGASGIAGFILRWFHTLCWLFLATAALAMSQLTPLPAAWAVPLAAIGGAIYAIFALTGLMTGKLL